jgi:peptidoglycan/xylan/chitin deacetylase (PgdA/CDA1 family)
MMLSAELLINRSPISFFFHRRSARHLTVLAYHGIDDPVRFSQHLDYLMATMHPISLNQVVANCFEGARLPPSAVLITFDDGEYSVLEHGLPQLSERGLPAVVFVVVGHLDSQQPFWWTEVEDLLAHAASLAELAASFPDLSSYLSSHMPAADVVRALKKMPNQKRLEIIDQLREISREIGDMGASPVRQLRQEELARFGQANIAVGNHTWTHPCLPTCTQEEIRDEIMRSHRLLTAVLGCHPRVFAYPNGDWTESAEGVLDELGYQAAFLFDHRLSSVPPRNPLRISRVRVNSHTSLERFKLIVSGIHPALHHVIGRN